jgi:hypothetical protein
VAVEDVEDVSGATCLRHFDVSRMKDKGISLLAAHAAVTADQLFEGGNSAIWIDGAEEPKIAGAGGTPLPGAAARRAYQ